jgi:hypothetical protein
MSARIWLDVDHPANQGVLRSLQSGVRKRTAPLPLAPPESAKDAYSKCGSHPDIVERVWDRLGKCLPENGRCLVYGVPALVHPRAGIVLSACYGTAYCLRVPGDQVSAAIAAGLTTVERWSDGTQTDASQEFGPDWVFGAWKRKEREWLRAVYDLYTPKAQADEPS